MTQQRPRSEDDLRAAFQLAAQDAPDRDAVLRPIYAPARPPSFARRFPILAPLGAAAAVLLVVGVVYAVVHSSGPGRNTAASKAEGAAASAFSIPAIGIPSNAAVGSASSVPDPISSAPAGTDGPSAGHTCTPDELALSIVWTESGTSLTGTLTAKNKATAACNLLVVPIVVPLDASGQPLDVRNVTTAIGAVGPQRLLPGATAASHLTWSMWCQRTIGGSAQVSWGNGTATASVQHDAFTPTHTACPDNTAASTLSSTYFSPLS